MEQVTRKHFRKAFEEAVQPFKSFLFDGIVLIFGHQALMQQVMGARGGHHFAYRTYRHLKEGRTRWKHVVRRKRRFM